MALRRRHFGVWIAGVYPFPEHAFGRIAWRDRALGVPFQSRSVERIETQTRFAFFLVEAMASKAFIGQDRTDVAIVTERGLGHQRA